MSRGQVIAPADIGAQMRQALGNLQIALEESGAELRDVVKTTVYVASGDRADRDGLPHLRRRGPGAAAPFRRLSPVTAGRQAAGRRDRPGGSVRPAPLAVLSPTGTGRRARRLPTSGPAGR
jgi:hypothetical protein